MRIHSQADYSQTQMLSCPLCYVCYHDEMTMQLHIDSNHPDFDEQVNQMRKYKEV